MTATRICGGLFFRAVRNLIQMLAVLKIQKRKIVAKMPLLMKPKIVSVGLPIRTHRLVC